MPSPAARPPSGRSPGWHAGHLTPRSVWFRNSIRGAAGLALAVLVVEETTVQHGFWVVLGTLSVLRSNALGTGATAVRAVFGTAIGFVVGYVVLLTLGPHDTELWFLLPVAVLVAGIAPTAISFTAGQAGFTVFVVLVFNILEPVGSRIGLIRIEDVLIGAVVSVVVGLLFWPRGAGAELARALGHAYAAAASWLAATVDEVGRADDGPVATGGVRWTPERTAAMAAARRLDDAYRQYLAERGAKQVPISVITRLVTGSARIRLTAVTLDGLPDLAVPGAPAPLPEVVTARATVSSECGAVESWFDRFASSLGGRFASGAGRSTRGRPPRSGAGRRVGRGAPGGAARRRHRRAPAPVGRGADGRPPSAPGRSGRDGARRRPLGGAGTRPEDAPHGDPGPECVESDRPFVLPDRRQPGARVRDLLEAEGQVERRVERDVAVGGEGELAQSRGRGPPYGRLEQGPADPPAAVFGQHRDLGDMGGPVDELE